MKILFKNISYIDENFAVQEHSDILIENEHIASIGKDIDVDGCDKVIDGDNKLLSPGFYDIHSHIPMSLLRGYAEDLKLQEWLMDWVFPFEAHLNSEHIYNGTMLGIAEALRFGIVSITDMYMDTAAIAESCAETGFKASLALMAPVGSSSDPFPYAGAEDILKKWHKAEDGRIIVNAAVHAEYTTRREFVEAVAAFAKENDLRLHTHISETAFEHEECKQRHNGLTPIAYFADCGAFDVPATAAHCVHIEPEDIIIMKEKGVSLATNPVSNGKLSSGMAPLEDCRKAGINIGLGTDGVSSNNALNMLADLRSMIWYQRIKYNDPTVFDAKTAWKLATRNGALAQGREDCGLIKEGFRADLIMFDLDKPYLYPRFNILNNLVYSAQGTDIVMTMVDGKILYQDGEYTTLDLRKVIADVEASTKAILQKLN